MLRPASRRLILSTPSTTSTLRQPQTFHRARRLLSTAPPARKPRSWKSSFARWGLAIGGVYYYNTSNVFAEEALEAFPPLPEYQQEDHAPSTLEAIAEQKRQAKAALEARERRNVQPQDLPSTTQQEDEESESPRTAQEYEDEADQQGAFNPETGEINWDCPCLGGMAHGPCGENFREAFSCFVFSKEEPKGMDCIDKFKGMQDCFRRFPEVYGSELEDDDEGQEEEADANEKGIEAGSPSTLPPPPSSDSYSRSSKSSAASEASKGPEIANVGSSEHESSAEDDAPDKPKRRTQAKEADS